MKFLIRASDQLSALFHEGGKEKLSADTSALQAASSVSLRHNVLDKCNVFLKITHWSVSRF